MNNVNLIGRITRDLELRYFQNSTAVLSFSIAVDKNHQRAGEEKNPNFISCKAFGKKAEVISKYFTKGSQIGITGELQTGSYEKDNKKHYTTDVVVDQITFVGSKKNGNEGADDFDIGALTDEELPF